MKRYTKLLYAVAAGFLLCACTSDPLPGPALPEPTANPHAVSEEEALSRLEALLRDWDGEGTRSGGVRRIASVATVTAGDVCQPRTRGEGGDPVDNMFYLVNFEDGAGYAILGADDRLEPVYVIADEGSLGADRLHYAATVSDEQAEADGEFVYPLQLILDSAAGSIATAGVGGPIGGIGGHGPGGWEPQPTVVDRKEDWVKTRSVLPMLKTKWDQVEPYNYFCPMIDGKYCYAGCNPVGTAQLLAYHAEKDNMIFVQFGEFVFNIAFWRNLKNAVLYPERVREATGDDGMTAETMAVANFIHAVGVSIRAKYGLSGTSAPTDNTANIFRNLVNAGVGYKNIQHVKKAIDVTLAKERICEKQLPIWYCGYSDEGGHVWILDGWETWAITTTVLYSNGTRNVNQTDEHFVHCNFGWGGWHDGYYIFHIFDPKGDGPVARPYSSSTTAFNRNFEYIIYDLSK